MRHLGIVATPVCLLLLIGGASAEVATKKAATQQETSVEKRSLERRAVEAVIWGMPAVNFQLMLDAFVSLGGGANQVVYWSQPLNWKDQTLTPNPDTIYLTPFYDTRQGPVVLEIPPADGGSITGSIDTSWQEPLEDVGPAGVDKGKGGKYLILPPGYKAKVPDGYIALPSPTYQGFAILRSNLKSRSDADVAAAVTYGKRIKFYPLPATDGAASATRFVDAYDKMYDSTIPYDARFFSALNRFIQVEPWLTRDKVMIGQLAMLGIAKGSSESALSPNKGIFDAAAPEARELIEAWTDKVYIPPFYENTHWALPAAKALTEDMPGMFSNPDRYPVDDRAVVYSLAYFSAKHLGTGQFYLMTVKDKSGSRLLSNKTYRLHVPPNPPVKLYWSATAYDGSTHALIRNTSRSSRGSNSTELQSNPDGSVDLYFASVAPPGKQGNWVPTGTQGRFEILFRFYGPDKAFFEKVWKLPDLELVK